MSKENYPEWYVDVKNLSPNWVSKNFLDFMDLKLEDCKGKNITSIGWWFGIFEMDAAKAWANVIVVDPLFSDDSWIDWKIQENVDWLNDKMGKNHHTIVNEFRNNILKALSECEDDNERLELEDRLSRCGERELELDEYASRREELLKHLKEWKKNQHLLVLNHSSGDNIHWIDIGSQDMVVIWHTLSHIHNKSDWSIKKFLEEWLKILKDDGKLWIIDYIWDNQEFENILINTNNKEYYKENKWSFVCCFDKKWLNMFLEEDIQFYS